MSSFNQSRTLLPENISVLKREVSKVKKKKRRILTDVC